MTEPLIYTSQGNLPISSLNRQVVWMENEKEQEITCNTEYWLGDECVRREVNIHKKTGFETLGTIGAI